MACGRTEDGERDGTNRGVAWQRDGDALLLRVGQQRVVHGGELHLPAMCIDAGDGEVRGLESEMGGGDEREGGEGGEVRQRECDGGGKGVGVVGEVGEGRE